MAILRGKKEDIQGFLEMLSENLGLQAIVDEEGRLTRAAGPPTRENGPFTAIFDQISSSLGPTIDVASGSQTVVLDCSTPPPGGLGFWNMEVDVEDLGRLEEPAPRDFPDAMTRCEALIHILAEYNSLWQQARRGRVPSWRKAHDAGIEAQNEHRRAHGQSGSVELQEINEAGTEGGTLYSNGASTTITIENGGITADPTHVAGQ